MLFLLKQNLNLFKEKYDLCIILQGQMCIFVLQKYHTYVLHDMIHNK